MLAVGGGDGTVACAPGVAVKAGVPLAVFPGRHVQPFREGHRLRQRGQDRRRDPAGQCRLRRPGVPQRGAHGDQHREHRRIPDVRADAREAGAQDRQAAGRRLYAMLHTLRRDEPVRIAYDNKTLQTSLFFLGNSTYLPSGFAPSRRTRMDDGLIDVRILETGRRFSRRADSGGACAGSAGAQPAVSRAAGARVHLQVGGRPDGAGA